MTDQQQAAPEPEVREITFRDRVLLVKLPTPEQVLVWKRTMTQVEAMEKDPATDGYAMMRLIDRTRRIIDSVLVNEADKEWLDDLMLDGKLPLNEACQVVIMGMEAFGAGANNREERRAATPAKRVRRKAPTAP